MIGIYKITNLINQKVYIGQSINIQQRWEEHKYYSSNEKTLLQKAFKKYGIDNFNFEVIEECDIKDLDDKEIYWIKYYDSFKNGYNLTEGGKTHRSLDYDLILETYLKVGSITQTSNSLNIHRDSVRRALEYFNIDYNKDSSLPQSVVMIDPYTLKELQTFISIKDASNFLNISDTTIRKHLSGQLETAGGYFWKKADEEKCFKPLKKEIRKTTKPKIILQYDLDGNYIGFYKSLSAANQAFNMHRSNTQIKKVCEGIKEEAFGYKWKYKD